MSDGDLFDLLFIVIVGVAVALMVLSIVMIALRERNKQTPPDSIIIGGDAYRTTVRDGRPAIVYARHPHQPLQTLHGAIWDQHNDMWISYYWDGEGRSNTTGGGTSSSDLVLK